MFICPGFEFFVNHTSTTCAACAMVIMLVLSILEHIRVDRCR